MVRGWFDVEKSQLDRHLVKQADVIIHLVTLACDFEENPNNPNEGTASFAGLMMLLLPITDDMKAYELKKLQYLNSNHPNFTSMVIGKRDAIEKKFSNKRKFQNVFESDDHFDSLWNAISEAYDDQYHDNVFQYTDFH